YRSDSQYEIVLESHSISSASWACEYPACSRSRRKAAPYPGSSLHTTSKSVLVTALVVVILFAFRLISQSARSEQPLPTPKLFRYQPTISSHDILHSPISHR